MECTTVTTTDPTLTLATTAAYRPTTQQNLTAHLERVSEAVLLRSQFSVAQFSPRAFYDCIEFLPPLTGLSVHCAL